jgi:hypothetical protein
MGGEATMHKQYYNHKKVKHNGNEFVRERKLHINGVESFWSCTKRRIAKFN